MSYVVSFLLNIYFYTSIFLYSIQATKVLSHLFPRYYYIEFVLTNSQEEGNSCKRKKQKERGRERKKREKESKRAREIQCSDKSTARAIHKAAICLIARVFLSFSQWFSSVVRGFWSKIIGAFNRVKSSRFYSRELLSITLLLLAPR